MLSLSSKYFIDEFSKEGEVYEKVEDNKVRCLACYHKCLIFPDKRGICKVRYNKDGKLYVPYNYVSVLNNDPIEKKPFYHVLPSCYALSYGMLGCNHHCSYCQNWDISQYLKDKQVKGYFNPISKEEIVNLASKLGSKCIISTYNEPLITVEWSYEIFELAKRKGFLTGFVSSGYSTIQSLFYIKPVCDLYKIDLKSFNDKNYRKLGVTLKGVLESIINVKSLGFHLEIVTLVVPNFNDSQEEIKQMAKFIYSVDKDIPYHLTAFHPDYKMLDTNPTSKKTLLMAYDIARDVGLNYVYIGNMPSLGYQNTLCPVCNYLLIERNGFIVKKIDLVNSRCPKCGNTIKGIF